DIGAIGNRINRIEAVICSTMAENTSLSFHYAVSDEVNGLLGGVVSTDGLIAYTGTSDPRRKKSIEEIDVAAAYERILAIRPVEFSWRENPEDEAFDPAAARIRGYLSTDVEPHIPQAVVGEADGTEDIVRIVTFSEARNVERPPSLGEL